MVNIISKRIDIKDWYKKLFDLLSGNKEPASKDINDIFSYEVTSIKFVSTKNIAINNVPSEIEKNNELSDDNTVVSDDEVKEIDNNIDDNIIFNCKYFNLIIPKLIELKITEKLPTYCENIFNIAAEKAKLELNYPGTDDNDSNIDKRISTINEWIKANKELNFEKEQLSTFILQTTLCFVCYELKEIWNQLIFSFINFLNKKDKTLSKEIINKKNFTNKLVSFLINNKVKQACFMVSCNILPNQSSNESLDEQLDTLKKNYSQLKEKYEIINDKYNNQKSYYEQIINENKKELYELKQKFNDIEQKNKVLSNDKFLLENQLNNINNELEKKNQAFEAYQKDIQESKEKEIIVIKNRLKEALSFDLENAKEFFEYEKGNPNIVAGLRKLERALENIYKLGAGNK